MKNLENLKLKELTIEEQVNIEGGNPIVVAIAVGLAWSAWENIGDIREGFSDGFNGKKPRY